jgi:ketosteroid isomerase-like protein
MKAVPIPWRPLLLVLATHLLVPWLGTAQDPKRVTPPRPPAPPTPEQQVIQQERAWSRAILRHDIETIADLLAEDYVRTSPDGRVHTKAEAILEFDRDRDKYTASTFDDPRVRIFGEVAVVQAGGIDRGIDADTGKPFVRRYRYTDVWVRRAGSWKCVASHSSEVAAP